VNDSKSGGKAVAIFIVSFPSTYTTAALGVKNAFLPARDRPQSDRHEHQPYQADLILWSDIGGGKLVR
jgi:hypothetical protein